VIDSIARLQPRLQPTIPTHTYQPRQIEASKEH